MSLYSFVLQKFDILLKKKKKKTCVRYFFNGLHELLIVVLLSELALSIYGVIQVEQALYIAFSTTYSGAGMNHYFAKDLHLMMICRGFLRGMNPFLLENLLLRNQSLNLLQHSLM